MTWASWTVWARHWCGRGSAPLRHELRRLLHPAPQQAQGAKAGDLQEEIAAQRESWNWICAAAWSGATPCGSRSRMTPPRPGPRPARRAPSARPSCRGPSQWAGCAGGACAAAHERGLLGAQAWQRAWRRAFAGEHGQGIAADQPAQFGGRHPRLRASAANRAAVGSAEAPVMIISGTVARSTPASATWSRPGRPTKCRTPAVRRRPGRDRPRARPAVSRRRCAAPVCAARSCRSAALNSAVRGSSWATSQGAGDRRPWRPLVRRVPGRADSQGSCRGVGGRRQRQQVDPLEGAGDQGLGKRNTRPALGPRRARPPLPAGELGRPPPGGVGLGVAHVVSLGGGRQCRRTWRSGSRSTVDGVYSFRRCRPPWSLSR